MLAVGATAMSAPDWVNGLCSRVEPHVPVLLLVQSSGMEKEFGKEPREKFDSVRGLWALVRGRGKGRGYRPMRKVEARRQG